MLISIDRQLRRQRRRALIALVVLTLGAIALSAHVAVMGSTDAHMSQAAAICLTIGGCVGVIVVAAMAIGRLRQRPAWLLPAPGAPRQPVRRSSIGYLVRAGPPPVLQVFRL